MTTRGSRRRLCSHCWCVDGCDASPSETVHSNPRPEAPKKNLHKCAHAPHPTQPTPQPTPHATHAPRNPCPPSRLPAFLSTKQAGLAGFFSVFSLLLIAAVWAHLASNARHLRRESKPGAALAWPKRIIEALAGGYALGQVGSLSMAQRSARDSEVRVCRWYTRATRAVSATPPTSRLAPHTSHLTRPSGWASLHRCGWWWQVD